MCTLRDMLKAYIMFSNSRPQTLVQYMEYCWPNPNFCPFFSPLILLQNLEALLRYLHEIVEKHTDGEVWLTLRSFLIFHIWFSRCHCSACLQLESHHLLHLSSLWKLYLHRSCLSHRICIHSFCFLHIFLSDCIYRCWNPALGALKTSVVKSMLLQGNVMLLARHLLIVLLSSSVTPSKNFLLRLVCNLSLCL